jgi:hypothetical protein
MTVWKLWKPPILSCVDLISAPIIVKTIPKEPWGTLQEQKFQVTHLENLQMQFDTLIYLTGKEQHAIVSVLRHSVCLQSNTLRPTVTWWEPCFFSKRWPHWRTWKHHESWWVCHSLFMKSKNVHDDCLIDSNDFSSHSMKATNLVAWFQILTLHKNCSQSNARNNLFSLSVRL